MARHVIWYLKPPPPPQTLIGLSWVMVETRNCWFKTTKNGRFFFCVTFFICFIMFMVCFRFIEKSSFNVFSQILLHEHDSEYWFQYNLNPSKRSALYIDTNTNDGIFGSRVTLKYKVEENVPRKNYICNPKETMRSYTQCAFDKLVINGCSKSHTGQKGLWFHQNLYKGSDIRNC